ncbi:MAG: LysM domain-containing protein [Thermodesulfobacteriota bacterium]|nr:LysM domain-containing protein [Thermodesulfobacteriota bacterium]
MKDLMGRKTSSDFRVQRKTLPLGITGILFLIILIAIFLGIGNDVSMEDLSEVQAKLNHLDKRLTQLEGIEDKIVSFIKQQKEFLHYVENLNESGSSPAQQPDKLVKRFGQMKKGVTSVPAKSEASSEIKMKPFSSGTGHHHIVRPGDSLSLIAQLHGMSVDELCRLNQISLDRIIYPGQKLLLSPDNRQ